ncbi:hypothetical protein BDZ89DRAFT_1036424 [Hymenopellis radicata]|nr:hypothetical protein BDZ89DRAFT_1036424 [Hymenopellis radicata]
MALFCIGEPDGQLMCGMVLVRSTPWKNTTTTWVRREDGVMTVNDSASRRKKPAMRDHWAAEDESWLAKMASMMAVVGGRRACERVVVAGGLLTGAVRRVSGGRKRASTTQERVTSAGVGHSDRVRNALMRRGQRQAAWWWETRDDDVITAPGGIRGPSRARTTSAR